MEIGVEAYAALMAELIAAGEARGEVLSRHGLDEARWEAIDARWQERLSEALDAEDEGVAPLLSAYAAAFAEAQRALAPPVSVEQLAAVTRLFQASGDLRAALAKSGVSLADYVRGAEHWSRRIAVEPAIERRFEAALRAR
ncbi:MAG: hypothetical protein U0359_16080 [Byssovorax sp.]